MRYKSLTDSYAKSGEEGIRQLGTPSSPLLLQY